MDGVTVAVVASRTEAELIVGLLRSNGLRADVSADDAAGLDPQLQLQGVRVLVAPADETQARRLLADAGTAGPLDRAAGAFIVPPGAGSPPRPEAGPSPASAAARSACRPPANRQRANAPA